MLKDLPTGRKVKIIGGMYVGGIGVIVRSTEFFYYVNLWRSIGEKCRGDEEVEDLMFCLLKLCIIW